MSKACPTNTSVRYDGICLLLIVFTECSMIHCESSDQGYIATLHAVVLVGSFVEFRSKTIDSIE